MKNGIAGNQMSAISRCLDALPMHIILTRNVENLIKRHRNIDLSATARIQRDIDYLMIEHIKL